MTSLTSIALAALAAGVIGLSAPTAYAQQAPLPNGPGQVEPMPPGPGPGHHMHGRDGGGHQGRGHHGGGMGGRHEARGGMLDLVCSADGAQRLESHLTALSQRLTLTAEQQPLFDTLRNTALTAQTQFADACTAARPTGSADAQPAPVDPVARMRARVAVEKAHTAAIESVLPSLEAFFASLSDEQKAQLPQRGRGDGRHKGMGMMQPRGGAPALPAPGMQAPAPTAPAAPATQS